MFKKAIDDIFKIEDSYDVTKRSFLLTFIVAALAYYEEIITGYTNADGVIEGIVYYENAFVASSWSGRWLVRYVEAALGNTVSPLVNISLYVICIWVSVLAIARLLKIDNHWFIYLSCAACVVCPSVIAQISYLYMVPCYAFCCLLSTLFVYFNHLEDKRGLIAGTLCMSASLALYQSYVGMSAALVAMLLITELFDQEKEISAIGKEGVRYLLSAVSGGVLYLLGMKLDLMLHPIYEVNRISAFSLKEILSNLGVSVINCYKVYFGYFIEYILKRRYIYMVILLLLAVSIVLHVFRLIKNKKAVNAGIGVLFIIMIPLLSNIIGVLIPSNEITILMSFQNYLVIPLCFALWNRLSEIKYASVSRGVLVATVTVLCWTLIISGFSTFKAYQLSYQHYNSQMQMLLADIYHKDWYEKDKTPVLIVGYVDDSVLRKNIKIYRNAIDLPDNVAFWEDYNGVTYNRRNYFMYYFGVDLQDIDLDLYLHQVYYSDWLKEMPVWPQEGSIIDYWGVTVVRLAEDLGW